MRWLGDRRRHRERRQRRSEPAYSAATICGVKSMPIAFATPAPYSGSAL
jgi:hypothetical protein